MKPVDRSVVAVDGWRLSALDFEPPDPPRAVVVLGHAMMVDRRTVASVHRPCLAQTLVEHGFRVLAVDLRGHGASGPPAHAGGAWTYDDLVGDTEAWLEMARSIAGDLPIFWVSHSLFGHVSLAWFGQHPERAPAAYVGIAVNVWNRRWEAERGVWLLQRTVSWASNRLVDLWGRMPVRALRMGPADEAAGYWHDIGRFASSNSWMSRDGVDYHAGLGRLTTPYLCVVSDGDRFFTRPGEAIAFSGPLTARTVLHLGPTCVTPGLRDLDLGHMALVTDRRAAPLWQEVAGWLGTHVPVCGASTHPSQEC